MSAHHKRNEAHATLDATGKSLARSTVWTNHWVLLISLAGIQFTHVLDFVLIMPLGPQLMRVFSISPAKFGLLVSNYNIAAAFAGLIGAFFLDRFDRKSALLSAYLGFTAGTLACGLAPDYSTLVAARVIAGAFGGLLQALIFTIIGDSFAEQDRGAATGTVMSAFSVASVLGVPFGLFLANRYEWRTPFIVLAAVSAAIWLIGATVLPPVRSHLSSRTLGDVRSAFKSTVRLVFERNTLIAFGLIISLMFAGFTVIPFMSAYLVANVGLKESDLAYVFLAGGLATFLSSRLIGRVADRLGKARVFTWLALFSMGPILALTHLRHVSILSAIVVSTLFTVLISARGIPALAMITSSIERERRGSFLSLTSAVQQAASGLASLAAGTLLSRNTAGEITNYGLVGALAVVSTLLSVWAAQHLKPPTRS